MTTNRTQIVDKNGKLTHVWKTDENGRRSAGRVAGISAPNTQHSSDKLVMDELFESADNIINLAPSIIHSLRERPDERFSSFSEWNSKHQKLYSEIINAAVEAATQIENIELELNAYEQTSPADRETGDRREYENAVQMLRLVKRDITKALDESQAMKNPILSPLITRTWESGLAAAIGLYGRPDMSQDLSNGSTSLRWEHTDNIGSSGWRELTVNRVGNVTKFNSPSGAFTASSIDFPYATPDGGVELRGAHEGLTMHDAQAIAYISTGQIASIVSGNKKN